MQSKTLATIIGLSATVLGHPAAGNVAPHPNAAGGVSYPLPADFEPNQCYCCPTSTSVISSGLCGAVDFETKATTCAPGDNLVCCGDGLCNSIPVVTTAGGLNGLVTSLLNLVVDL